MTPLKNPAVSSGFTTGYPVVIGPRAALYRYADRPWAEVIEAAERGADGLRADRNGSATAQPLDQEFMLREMVVGPSSAFHGYTALAEQRW